MSIIVLFSFLHGCAGKIDPQLLDKFHSNHAPSEPIGELQNPGVEVHYLGVSGYLIDYEGYQLLLGPSFTNPGYGGLLWSLFTGSLADDPELIEQYYPQKGKDNPSNPKANVEAILVGHSHYDHLLDVPYIMKHYTKTAHAYGSLTMQSLLQSKGIPLQRTHALNDKASDHQNHNADNWQYVSDRRIRFLALKSDHAPLVAETMFAPGRYDGKPLDSDINFLEWKLGQPFAFLIDFLDEQQNIVFRIHYVDTSSKAKNGFVPQQVLDEKRVDLAILCLAAFDHGGAYPTPIVTHLNPKNMIAGHWEHFFSNQGKKQKVVFGSDHQAFIERLKTVLPTDGRWIIPSPNTLMKFSLED